MFRSNFQAILRRVAIVIVKGVQFTVHTHSAGCYVIISGTLYSLTVILVCFYAPNWDDQTFFKNLLSNLPDYKGADSNCSLSALDWSFQGKISISRTAQAIKYILVNTRRSNNPTTRIYSFFSSVHKSYLHIDYVNSLPGDTSNRAYSF